MVIAVCSACVLRSLGQTGAGSLSRNSATAEGEAVQQEEPAQARARAACWLEELLQPRDGRSPLRGYVSSEPLLQLNTTNTPTRIAQ